MSKHRSDDDQSPEHDGPRTHAPVDPPSEDYTAMQAGAPFNTAATGYSGEVSGHGPGHRPVGEAYDGPAAGYTGPPPGSDGRRTAMILALIIVVAAIVAVVIFSVA